MKELVDVDHDDLHHPQVPRLFLCLAEAFSMALSHSWGYHGTPGNGIAPVCFQGGVNREFYLRFIQISDWESVIKPSNHWFLTGPMGNSFADAKESIPVGARWFLEVLAGSLLASEGDLGTLSSPTEQKSVLRDTTQRPLG